MLNTELATQLAMRSLHHKSKHAAIVFCQGMIIGIANNSKQLHAEVRAVQVAYWNQGGLSAKEFNKEHLTLFSIAVTKTGKLKLAKPCSKCQQYLNTKNIKDIWYSTNAQTIVRMK